MSMKNPLKPAGIESATFRFGARNFNVERNYAVTLFKIFYCWVLKNELLRILLKMSNIVCYYFACTLRQ